MPNLVQTLENNPAFVHGGPFANIAHGCNSVMATKTALKLADYVVTEAGFGADLGAEKFFDIKCRKAGLKPDAAVIVATVRALKMHGGVAKDDARARRTWRRVRKGCANLGRHIDNVKQFGVPVVVAVNHFIADTEAEVDAVQRILRGAGRRGDHVHATGPRAARAPRSWPARWSSSPNSGQSQFSPLYQDDMPLWDKIRTDRDRHLRRRRHRRRQAVRDQLKGFEDAGYGKLPICMAKTQYSFSTDPNLKGAPTTMSCRSARCGCRPAPSSSSPSAARS